MRPHPSRWDVAALVGGGARTLLRDELHYVMSAVAGENRRARGRWEILLCGCVAILGELDDFLRVVESSSESHYQCEKCVSVENLGLVNGR